MLPIGIFSINTQVQCYHNYKILLIADPCSKSDYFLFPAQPFVGITNFLGFLCSHHQPQENVFIYSFSLLSKCPVMWSEVKVSHVWLFGTPWTVARLAPLPMGFSRQEYWSGLPFPPPGDLLNPEIRPKSPALQADSLPPEPLCLLGRSRREPPTPFGPEGLLSAGAQLASGISFPSTPYPPTAPTPDASPVSCVSCIFLSWFTLPLWRDTFCSCFLGKSIRSKFFETLLMWK